MVMTERLLQYIWQFQYFNRQELVTVQGDPLQIIQQGKYNTHQGPDFLEAKIKIDDQFNDTFATAHEDFSGSESKGDWIYGVGFEYGFNDCWSMKIEYLYADFGEVTGTSDNLTAFSPAIAYPTNTFTHTADLQLDVLRIGFNYRF